MSDTVAAPVRAVAEKTTFSIIIAVAVCHFLNDVMQSLLTAIYPILKVNYGLDFVQIGLLTLTFQCTASLLQPAIGMYADKRPLPYSLAVGMGSTLVGLIVLGFAQSYPLLLLGAALAGAGGTPLAGKLSRAEPREALLDSLLEVDCAGMRSHRRMLCTGIWQGKKGGTPYYTAAGAALST